MQERLKGRHYGTPAGVDAFCGVVNTLEGIFPTNQINKQVQYKVSTCLLFIDSILVY